MLVEDPVPRHAITRFLLTFGLIFGVLLVWSIAIPPYGAPDENQHLVKAYAIVHGETGRLDPATGERVFRVPAILSGDPVCFAIVPNQPASCQQLDSSSAEHETLSRAAPYPPFYYLLVGWPSQVSSGKTMLQLMRGASAFWVSLLVALALHNATRIRRRAPLLPAFLVVLSPVLFFLGATVTPSGVSIAAGLAVWTGGFVLLRGEASDRLGLAVSRVGAPLCLLILIRRDSVLWAALVVLALLALAAADTLRALVRSWVAWLWAAVVVACVVVQLSLSGAETATSIGGGSGNFRAAVGELPYYVFQMVGGILGWLDTWLPVGVYLVLFLVLGFVVIASLGFAPRRLAALTGLMVAVILIVPVVIGSRSFPYFQGRYLLPFAVGLPLVAALGLVESRVAPGWPKRLGWILVPVVAVAQVGAFAQTMRRFTAGAGGEWWFFSPPSWQPEIASPTTLVVLYAVVLTAALAWLGLTFTQPDESEIEREPELREV
jgi:hypothetical protein